jgi:hypothetical protein
VFEAQQESVDTTLVDADAYVDTDYSSQEPDQFGFGLGF